MAGDTVSAFHSWAAGLDWGSDEETLIEQRERIMRTVLPHIWEKQQAEKRNKDIAKNVGQLMLF